MTAPAAAPPGPNLLLVAAPRSGSTQLARWLDSHPAITLAPVKEPNIFAAHEFDPGDVARDHLNDVAPARYVRGPMTRPAQFAVFREMRDYLALFRQMTTPWRMEASTTYLACPEAPDRIAAALPGVRLILLTRDPLERALSHYRLARRTGRSTRPLEAELADEIAGRTPPAARFLLRPSRQAAGVARFQARFGAKQCLTLRFEDMVRAPRETLEQIAAFLDLPAGGFDLTREARNAGHAPRFAGLNRLLQATGAKTALRRALPRPLKRRLAPLWFDAARPLPIPDSARQALAQALYEGDPAP